MIQGGFWGYVGIQCQGIEANSQHEEQLVYQNVPDCAELAAVLVVIAQTPGDGITAAIRELGEVNGDEWPGCEFGSYGI